MGSTQVCITNAAPKYTSIQNKTATCKCIGSTYVWLSYIALNQPNFMMLCIKAPFMNLFTFTYWNIFPGLVCTGVKFPTLLL